MRARLLGTTSIYVFAGAANAAVPLLLLPVLTRVLSPSDYGLVGMFNIAVSVLAAFTGVNVNAALGVRFFQLESQHFARYVGSSLLILGVSSVVVAIAVALSGSALEPLIHVPAAWLLVAVLAAAAQTAINIRLTLWQVRHQAFSYGAFQFALVVCNAGLSLLLVLVLEFGWTGRVLGQVGAAVVFMALAYIWLKSEIAPPAGTQDMKDALKFGAPLIPHVLGGLLIAATDRLMIANMLGLQQAGIYVVALQIGLAMALLTESFNKVYAPWLMGELRSRDAERDRRIVLGTYAYFVVITAAALVLGYVAPPILAIIAGSQFQEASHLVIYIAMGFAFCGMYYMVANYIFFASRTVHLALITFGSGLANVVMAWWLIKLNGLEGAAQAFMCSQALLFLGTWMFAQRARPMPWGRALLPATA